MSPARPWPVAALHAGPHLLCPSSCPTHVRGPEVSPAEPRDRKERPTQEGQTSAGTLQLLSSRKAAPTGEGVLVSPGKDGREARRSEGPGHELFLLVSKMKWPGGGENLHVTCGFVTLSKLEVVLSGSVFWAVKGGDSYGSSQDWL